MDRLQMPNTINATNPMPTNSTTSATESYSSQCRLPESMTFHPRRRCGFRDRRFRRRPARSRVQPKTYRHRGDPGGNAYDRASHRSSPTRAKLGYWTLERETEGEV